MNNPDMQSSKTTVRVWDLFVRIFHWSLVCGIAITWITAFARGDTHQWLGLAIGALVTARIFWGFLGSRYARFSQFIRSPGVSIQYLISILQNREQRYLGHNPAGALMIMALLASITATIATGWLMTTDAYFGDETMQLSHSICAYGVLSLAGLHIVGVVLASRRHQENLVQAMFTGNKRQAQSTDVE